MPALQHQPETLLRQGSAPTQDAQARKPPQHKARPIEHLSKLATWPHPALALLWLLAALAVLASPDRRWPGRVASMAAAILLALLPIQLHAGGYWPDMARIARFGLPAAALLWAALQLAPAPLRQLAPLTAFLLAGFHLAFGALALAHNGPLAADLAVKSMLTGGALLATLGLETRARRPAAALLAALLLAAALVTATRWAPALPAAGLFS